tara:strand:- start:765 stop:902 length:138 start_codon:yes stop_codon:yes gene_type:complete
MNEGTEDESRLKLARLNKQALKQAGIIADLIFQTDIKPLSLSICL